MSPQKTVILADNEKFRVEAQVQGEVLVFRPAGVMDEDTNLGEVFSALGVIGHPIQEIHFDLSHITRINSCGVRERLIFMQRAQAKYRIRFPLIGELMVEVAGITPAVLGSPSIEVDSFHAPYHCPKCNERFIKTLRVTSVEKQGGKFVAPAARCPKCGTQAEFDGMEEEYFAFLKRSLPKK